MYSMYGILRMINLEFVLSLKTKIPFSNVVSDDSSIEKIK